MFLRRALPGLLLALGACAADFTPLEIDAKLGQALAVAGSYADQRQPVEAEQLMRAVQRIDPEYYGLGALLERMPAQNRDLFRSNPLGANRARRYALERSFGERALRYLPDRLLDTLDIFSIEANFGPGAYAGFYATRGAQVAVGSRVVGGLGSYFRRCLFGTRVQADAALHAFGAGPLRSVGFIAGTGGVSSGGGDLSGVGRPQDAVYQSYQDYWSIGVSGTVGFVGASGELHLVQIADWLGGFFFTDLANDDSAHTRPLELRPADLDLLRELAEIEQSPALLSEYRRRRPELRLPER